MDDFVWGDELFDIVDDEAVLGVFADAGNVEKMGRGFVNEGTVEVEGEGFEAAGVDDGADNIADRGAGLDAENWGADQTGIIH